MNYNFTKFANISSPTFFSQYENYAYTVQNKKLIKYKLVSKQHIKSPHYSAISRVVVFPKTLSIEITRLFIVRLYSTLYFVFKIHKEKITTDLYFRYIKSYNENYVSLKIKELQKQMISQSK
jgi:hypothetical protein